MLPKFIFRYFQLPLGVLYVQLRHPWKLLDCISDENESTNLSDPFLWLSQVIDAQVQLC